MNNITIGQYVPGHSWIYKMDPRVKIFLVIGLIVVLFLIPNIYLMLGYLGLFAIMYLTTGLPIRKMLNGMKPVLFLATFTFILQVLYNQEGTLLYTFNFLFSNRLISVFNDSWFNIFLFLYEKVYAFQVRLFINSICRMFCHSKN